MRVSKLSIRSLRNGHEPGADDGERAHQPAERRGLRRVQYEMHHDRRRSVIARADRSYGGGVHEGAGLGRIRADGDRARTDMRAP